MQTNMYVFMYGLTDGCIDECMYDVSMYLNIHVASRRQPPAPHRWAHTNIDDEKACRPLRPKTSESTDCRKKKREEFDSHV